MIIYTVTSTSPWHGLFALELLIRSQLRLRVYSAIESPKYFKAKLTTVGQKTVPMFGYFAKIEVEQIKKIS